MSFLSKVILVIMLLLALISIVLLMVYIADTIIELKERVKSNKCKERRFHA